MMLCLHPSTWLFRILQIPSLFQCQPQPASKYSRVPKAAICCRSYAMCTKCEASKFALLEDQTHLSKIFGLNLLAPWRVFHAPRCKGPCKHNVPQRGASCHRGLAPMDPSPERYVKWGSLRYITNLAADI